MLNYEMIFEFYALFEWSQIVATHMIHMATGQPASHGSMIQTGTSHLQTVSRIYSMSQ
jgi:hypothetical protein